MYAYFCMHKLHWKPSDYADLPRKEKAVVIAFIQERIDEEKKQNNKMKSGARRSRR